MGTESENFACEQLDPGMVVQWDKLDFGFEILLLLSMTDDGWWKCLLLADSGQRLGHAQPGKVVSRRLKPFLKPFRWGTWVLISKVEDLG